MKHLKTIISVFLLLFFIVGCKSQNKVEEKTVKFGSIVTFDYAAGFDDGTLFDTSFAEVSKKAGIYHPDKKYVPEKINIGVSPLITGLTDALIGMKEGETKNIRIPPEKAYGAFIKNSTFVLQRSFLNNSENLKINDPITIVNSKNQKIITFVKNLSKDNITIDLNHPFAGKYIQFAILVRKIE